MAKVSARRLESSAALFFALGDKVRLRILSRLGEEGPLSISTLAEGAVISRQAVTKHLHVLEAEHLVRSSRKGREQIFELEAKRLQIATEALEMISRRWDRALERLRNLVEDES